MDARSGRSTVVGMAEESRSLVSAAQDERIRARYFAKIVCTDSSECWWWTGAISGHGHGRFWIRDGWVVIAHRIGWAIAHPGEDVPELVGHQCDNPLCQRPAHWISSTHEQNRAEWAARRHRLGSSLRDTRGARGRSRELRDGILAGADPTELERAGLSDIGLIADEGVVIGVAPMM